MHQGCTKDALTEQVRAWAVSVWSSYTQHVVACILQGPFSAAKHHDGGTGEGRVGSCFTAHDEGVVASPEQLNAGQMMPTGCQALPVLCQVSHQMGCR